MRRQAAVAALILLASAAASLPGTEAALGACQDGADNDGDGLADWPQDPGCGSASDPSESACPEDPAACVREIVPCGGMLPPGPLTAEWTPEGLLLEWAPPLSGDPSGYAVYRVDAQGLTALSLKGPDLMEPTRSIVKVPSLPPAPPLPTVPRIPKQVEIETTWGTAPLATVPASDTTFLDPMANPEGAYFYWVEPIGDGCHGPASNAAFAGFYVAIPPRVDDCLHVERNPPFNHTHPSTRCLDP